jgi:hypothetical protein
MKWSLSHMLGEWMKPKIIVVTRVLKKEGLALSSLPGRPKPQKVRGPSNMRSLDACWQRVIIFDQPAQRL